MLCAWNRFKLPWGGTAYMTMLDNGGSVGLCQVLSYMRGQLSATSCSSPGLLSSIVLFAVPPQLYLTLFQRLDTKSLMTSWPSVALHTTLLRAQLEALPEFQHIGIAADESMKFSASRSSQNLKEECINCLSRRTGCRYSFLVS